jgi:uncharacterized protein
MDPASRICEGCGRTLAEIGEWMRLTEPQRLAIMAALPARMHQLQERAKFTAS